MAFKVKKKKYVSMCFYHYTLLISMLFGFIKQFTVQAKAVGQLGSTPNV